MAQQTQHIIDARGLLTFAMSQSLAHHVDFDYYQLWLDRGLPTPYGEVRSWRGRAKADVPMREKHLTSMSILLAKRG